MTHFVPSPCINVCKMDEASGWCHGCLRSIGEIAGWSTMTDEGKRAVWKLLPQRRLQYAQLHPAAPSSQEPTP
jgi:uncharacterized protein